METLLSEHDVFLTALDYLNENLGTNRARL